MDEISKQLKNEIDSLQDFIQQTEVEHLAAHWVDEMLPPFERVEETFTQSELREIVAALHQAKNQFHVNGTLTGKIDSLLKKYSDLLPQTLPANADPEVEEEAIDDLGSLFLDEEQASPLVFNNNEPTPNSENDLPSNNFGVGDLPSHIDFGQDEEQEEAAQIIDFGQDDELGDPPKTIDFGKDEPGDPPKTIDFGKDEPTSATTVDFGKDEVASAAEDLFKPVSFNGEDDSTAPSEDLLPSSREDLIKSADEPALPALNADSLFTDEDKPQALARQKSTPSATPGMPRQNREEPTESLVNIFSDKVSLDDLMSRLDISLPQQDVTQLQHQLRNKLNDRVVRTLQTNKLAAGQYILIPRISRFVKDGTLYPCTVKNLVKNYIALFGDIKDLMRYREHPFLNNEIPALDWAIITPESQRESLGKNYMEQLQTLRYLATSLNLPSNLVRRRSLVEVIYDLIVGRMVLSKTFQKQSLDWTSSGPSKTDYICVHYADNGIRIRDLPRTTHNRSIGFCPNW